MPSAVDGYNFGVITCVTCDNIYLISADWQNSIIDYINLSFESLVMARVCHEESIIISDDFQISIKTSGIRKVFASCKTD